MQYHDGYLTMENLYLMAKIDSGLNLMHCINSGTKEVFVYQKKTNEDRYEFAYKENIDCLEKHNITWFPPYLTRVKKIDYTKFPENIREAIIILDKSGQLQEAEEALNKQK